MMIVKVVMMMMIPRFLQLAEETLVLELKCIGFLLLLKLLMIVIVIVTLNVRDFMQHTQQVIKQT